jgi:hypothetical protein
MKRFVLISIVLGGLTCFGAKANITDVTYASDGDGAIVCPVYTWSGSATEYDAPIYGDQYWGPAHVEGCITTDTTEDPTLILGSAIDNDTSFAWTAYQVNVYMNNNFTLSAANVTLPADWTLASIQLTAVPVVSPHGSYEAQLVFTSGTPVAVGDELDFSYKISFSGSTSYSFTQEMIPVPEPGTIGFLAAGALLLAGFGTARQRRDRLR